MNETQSTREELTTEYFLSGANFERKQILKMVDDLMRGETFKDVTDVQQAVGIIKLAISLRDPIDLS